FWIAAALVGYSYLGYPLWLWLRSRWSPRPVRRSTCHSSNQSSNQGSNQSSNQSSKQGSKQGCAAVPAVSAVMVVRNEEAVIARKLDNLLTLDYPQAKLDVVVVSDGSSDRTPAILAGYARDSAVQNSARTRVRTLMKPASQGKAAGL